MPQFCVLFYANYTILGTQSGARPSGSPYIRPWLYSINFFWSFLCSWRKLAFYLYQSYFAMMQILFYECY